MDIQLLLALQAYIDAHKAPVEEVEICAAIQPSECFEDQAICSKCAKIAKSEKALDLHVFVQAFIEDHKSADTFSSKLLWHIDQKGLSDAEVYKSAGVDRRHFSKIRSSRDYRPKKQTVLALGMALALPKSELINLLELAGHSLSSTDTSDLIILFCLEKEIYDVMQINEMLDYFGQKALISSTDE